jgi:tetratricopeptide (TPR) repeat protein
MKNGGYDAALPFLEKLIKSVNYGEAAVWLQYADCLQAAGRLEQAEEAFR